MRPLGLDCLSPQCITQLKLSLRNVQYVGRDSTSCPAKCTFHERAFWGISLVWGNVPPLGNTSLDNHMITVRTELIRIQSKFMSCLPTRKQTLQNNHNLRRWDKRRVNFKPRSTIIFVWLPNQKQLFIIHLTSGPILNENHFTWQLEHHALFTVRTESQGVEEHHRAGGQLAGVHSSPEGNDAAILYLLNYTT